MPAQVQVDSALGFPQLSSVIERYVLHGPERNTLR